MKNVFSKNMTQLLLGLLLALFFNACAGSDSSSQHKTEVENNRKLDETYAAVTGTYTGILQTASGPQEASLSVYTIPESAGFNPDGSERFRTLLKGNFKVVNPPGKTTIFTVQYIPETASMNFSNNMVNMNIDDVSSITGTINGDTYTAQLNRGGGFFGNMVLHRSGQQSSNGNQGDTNGYYNRLREQYRAISGSYAGTVVPPDQVSAPFKIIVRLLVTDTNVDGYSVPTLYGYYHRDEGADNGLDLNMTVAYRGDLNPATISFAGKGQYLYFVNIQGNLVGNKITGSFTAFNFVTDIVLTKKGLAPLK